MGADLSRDLGLVRAMRNEFDLHSQDHHTGRELPIGLMRAGLTSGKAQIPQHRLKNEECSMRSESE